MVDSFFFLSAILLVLSALVSPIQADSLLNITFLENGRLQIINLEASATSSQVWLQTESPRFHSDGRNYSVEDATLKLSSTNSGTGIDSVGYYTNYVYNWITTDTAAFETSYRVYFTNPNVPSSSPSIRARVRCIIFQQRWLKGTNQTSIKNVDSVLSAFPAFNPKNTEIMLGAQHWDGAFDRSEAFAFSGTNARLPTMRGRDSGPLVLFSRDTPRFVSVLSSFNQFMANSLTNVNGIVSFGIMGSIAAVPANWLSESILSFHDTGITNGVLEWGNTLLAHNNKQRLAAFDDVTVQYLGYNTDNGAVYYYNTEKNMNYEDTLIAVKKYGEQMQIPYRAMLLDSWWYYKSIGTYGGGVQNWTAKPDVFPHGLDYLSQQLRLPFIAHNRFFASDTQYAKQNGGQYDWVMAGDYSLPTSQAFWDDLIQNNTQWNLRVYEQDWLLTLIDEFAPIQSDVHLGRNWLHQMGEAAKKNGVNIQYCMPYPRHLLQSVEIPAVTQVRASDDNTPGQLINLVIGESALFSYALGVSAFKDGFWTMKVQPANPYHRDEPRPSLNCLIAVLSGGPVMPSDQIGYSNVTLLSRAYRSDGKILKADRPSFSLDVSYLHRAFPSSTNLPDAIQISHTYTSYEPMITTPTLVSAAAVIDLAVLQWHVVLVFNESHAYSLTTNDIQASPRDHFIAYPFHAENALLDQLRAFDAQSPLALEPNNVQDEFTVWYISPILNIPSASSTVPFVLFGETNKWIPVSKQRITAMNIYTDTLIFLLAGAANEKISISFALQSSGEDDVNQAMYTDRLTRDTAAAAAAADWQVMTATCIISADSTNKLTIQVSSKSWSC